MEDQTENVKSCSSSNPEMSVFENTLMSSEEDLIKAAVAKMVLEDDLTSAASHFCLYFCQSPFTCLIPPTTISVSPLFVLPRRRSEYQRGSPTDVLKHKRTVIKDDISKPRSLLLSSPLFITGDCSLLDNI